MCISIGNESFRERSFNVASGLPVQYTVTISRSSTKGWTFRVGEYSSQGHVDISGYWAFQHLLSLERFRSALCSKYLLYLGLLSTLHHYDVVTFAGLTPGKVSVSSIAVILDRLTLPI